MDKTTSEILRLSQAWYKYVGYDHHKDRDCHWYIEADFAYGGKPEFYVYHNGYIHDYIRKGPFKDWTTANEKLLKLIKYVILSEQCRIRECLEEPEEWEYESEGFEYLLGVELDG